MTFLLLSSLGAWVEVNITGVIMLILNLVFVTAWLVRLEQSTKNNRGDIDETTKRHERLSNQFSDHAKDKDTHVNHLYMSTIKEQLVKLEAMVQTGDRRIEERLDHLTERFYHKQN